MPGGSAYGTIDRHAALREESGRKVLIEGHTDNAVCQVIRSRRSAGNIPVASNDDLAASDRSHPQRPAVNEIAANVAGTRSLL
jgi:hypothetical protein